MTTPPWGHKPPPVADVERYWTEAPPGPSERCRYWLCRYVEGSWSPNRWVRREGYYGGADLLGIYIWEWWHVMTPLIARYEELPCRQVSLDEIWLSCKSVQ